MLDRRILHSSNDYPYPNSTNISPNQKQEYDLKPTVNSPEYDLTQIANIEKKINQTLSSFEVERNRQEKEVKKIKEEVESMDKCQSSYRQYISDNKIDFKGAQTEKGQSANVDYSIGIIQGLQKEKK